MIRKDILIAVIVLLLLTCQLSTVSAASTTRRYTPIYADKYKPTGKQPRRTLQGDFLWATNSPDLRTAAIRWKSFLQSYGERELGDAIEARLISIAKYELMRIYYLQGNSTAGDKLLKDLDPLKLLETSDQ